MCEGCEPGIWSPWAGRGEVDEAVDRLSGCATAAQTSTCPRHAVPKSPRCVWCVCVWNMCGTKPVKHLAP